METGFATLNGRLDVALTRTTQAEADIAQLRAEVEALKRGRWPLPTIGAIGGVVGAITAVYAALHP
ncbi:hypothetical protein ACH4E7_06755 [Kitasatospora sp. NPDC018058]|uniref:hypothetical protein n=1 Tax=Kitasatospora sp. NPDC018058 TaxID=3364025 RepID=UPI0037BFBFD0